MDQQYPNHLDTLAIHGGREPDPETGAVVPPLHFATTFERDADGEYRRGHVYGRQSHPTRDRLERALASIEGGSEAIAFASGLAACRSVFDSLAPDAHVVATADCYHGLKSQIGALAENRRMSVSWVDTGDTAEVASAIRDNTSLIWVESPSNPMMRIADLPALAELARDNDALLACDSTFCTAAVQRPLALGADLAVHSTTKFLGGHSDLIGGAVISRKAGSASERIREQQVLGGAIPSPFDCWLLMRSLSTMPVRLARQSASAERIAEWLSRRPEVAAVIHPSRPDHPGHDVARRDMLAWPGLLAFRVRGGEAAAKAVAGAARTFTRATSLGGVESLIEHRASIEGTGTRTPPDLIRLSVGLEHPDDLIRDLEQALTTNH